MVDQATEVHPLVEKEPSPQGRLKALTWEEGTYQDVNGHRHRCWFSPERLHGLKLYILDTRTLEAPLIMSGHTFDISKVPEEEREEKSFLLINGTSSRPKIETPISLHPTRGEAQERAVRIYVRGVVDLFVEDNGQDNKSEAHGIKSMTSNFMKLFSH